jgi:putative tricarboxylic transport membrane protein
MAGEVMIMVIFGGLGYLLRYFGYEAPPLILALVLGPMIEDRFKQSLTISGGSFSIFFTRPLALVFLIITLLILALSFLRHTVLKKPKKD